jgi:hypothetical protein
MTNTQRQVIDDYFHSILVRFYNMELANIDLIGIKKATKMVEGYMKTNTITPGEFQYIYNRTHPLGSLPKYNKSGKKWGLMQECPVSLLVEFVVDWRLPATDFKHHLAKQHPQFWEWYSNSNNLNRPPVNPIYRQLFTEG